MARWQNKGATYLVDREGVVIGPADSKRYAELPLIVGEGAPQAAPTLFDATAAEPELFQRIEAGVRVGPLGRDRSDPGRGPAPRPSRQGGLRHRPAPGGPLGPAPHPTAAGYG